VWQNLTEMPKDREPAPQPTEEMASEPPKKKMADDEALSTEKTLDRYRAEPSVSIDACQPQWCLAHKGALAKLAHIAQRYLATPASTVPCGRLFSPAGHIVQKKRSALSSEIVKSPVRLTCKKKRLTGLKIL